MSTAKNKTIKNEASVEHFLQGIDDSEKRSDSLRLLSVMKDCSRAEPRMWGPAMIGFGDYHYKYASGREGDWFLVGFSPRKANISVYLTGGLESHSELLARLGKHKTGKGCLYISKLSDVDEKVLREIITDSYKSLKPGQV